MKPVPPFSNDDFDWNLFIGDQCAKPEDFSADAIQAAWDGRWHCPQMIVDPQLLLYGC